MKIILYFPIALIPVSLNYIMMSTTYVLFSYAVLAQF